MPRNEPSASNTSAQLSVRCDAELKERYKDALDTEGRTMSEDLRQHMEQVVAEHGGAVSNAGHLPDDDELATAYPRLDDLADPDTRTISAEAAESALADALNRPKTTVRRAVLAPLQRRGYITPRWGDLRVTRPSDLVDIDAGGQPMPTEHRVGLPCPVRECRCNHLTEYGAAQHLRRAHDDVGRWGPEPAADGGVTISAHARERWRARSKQTRYSPAGAWASGVPVWQFPADAHQVRYHEPTRTVLLAKNGVVVTVLSFETATEPQKRAVRQALGGSPGRREQA